MVQSPGRGGGAAAGVPLKGGWVGKNNPAGEQRALRRSIRRESSPGSNCFWLQGTPAHWPKPSGKKKNPRPKQEREFE